MSATGKTKNYSLPIFNDNDATSWGEFNNAMTKIDENLKKVASVSDSANEKTDTNTQAISEFNNIVNSMKTKVDNNDTLVKNLNESVGLLETHDTEQDTRLNSIETNVNSISNINNKQETEISNMEKELNSKMGMGYDSYSAGELQNFAFVSNYLEVKNKHCDFMRIVSPVYPSNSISALRLQVEFTCLNDILTDYTIVCDSFESIFNISNGNCRALPLNGVILNSTGEIESVAYGYICSDTNKYGASNKKIKIKIPESLSYRPSEIRTLLLTGTSRASNF